MLRLTLNPHRTPPLMKKTVTLYSGHQTDKSIDQVRVPGPFSHIRERSSASHHAFGSGDLFNDHGDAIVISSFATSRCA
jgi:hypothetical protein